jgi:hypothetical protein
MNTWQKGAVAAAISGAAGGVSTGLASIGISPQHFNFAEPNLLFKVMATAAVINAVIGVAAYIKQSPLPSTN